MTPRLKDTMLMNTLRRKRLKRQNSPSLMRESFVSRVFFFSVYIDLLYAPSTFMEKRPTDFVIICTSLINSSLIEGVFFHLWTSISILVIVGPPESEAAHRLLSWMLLPFQMGVGVTLVTLYLTLYAECLTQLHFLPFIDFQYDSANDYPMTL